MTRDRAYWNALHVRSEAPPMICHHFGRFTMRQDPMLVARLVAIKQGKRVEVVR